jgi:hypothetical protein
MKQRFVRPKSRQTRAGMMTQTKLLNREEIALLVKRCIASPNIPPASVKDEDGLAEKWGFDTPSSREALLPDLNKIIQKANGKGRPNRSDCAKLTTVKSVIDLVNSFITYT